ncbi:hypothetical protein ACUVWM_18685 [Stenotrophomonas muris]|uniref:hypothetical protein n=1 Tax=Stenotrophomonas muris TaxID=2963283 RepID=UPI00405564C9
MDAIDARARELLDNELRKLGLHEDAHHVGCGADLDRNDQAAINAIAAALTPPNEPDQALLVSMAMLVYHGFGLLTPEQKQSQLREMRKLWDEVMGRGFYSPDNRERYVAILAARPEAP